MRQLVAEGPGQVAWRDAPDPDLGGPDEALVRPLAVALCDLDQPIVFAEAPIPPPVALGHECVAEVVAAGAGVRSVAPGQRVVVPFQISCGSCDRCRRGQTGDCREARAAGMYGFGAFGGDYGGFLSDLVRVPFADAMLVPVPDELASEAVASASDNIPDGWRTVAPALRERPGAEVLVLGGGAASIALYAVAAAVGLGAGRVDYLDSDPDRLAVASDLGAHAIEVADPPHRTEREYAITVDAGASRASVACAVRSTEPGGTCTSTGILFEPETPLPLLEMYTRGIHFHIGRPMARPTLEEILQLCAAGRLRSDRVTTEVAAWEEAPTAVLRRQTKLVLAR